MMRMFMKKCLVGAVLTTLGGCSLAPVYQRPPSPVADSFAGRYLTEQADLGSRERIEVTQLGWREVFTDPYLQYLIEMALKNNRDLRVVALNVLEFQAQYRIRRADQFPFVTGAAAATKRRTLAGSSHSTTETYAMEIGTTAFELDFFGRVRSLKDEALEQYLAMEETRKSATITLVAEVANAYLTWLADQEQLRISEDTEKVEADSCALVQQRLQAGIANELEFAQARTSLESVRANLVMYRRQVAEDFHYLLLLTGAATFEDLAEQNEVLFDETIPISVMPTSLSSDVLLQRPDIMAAEHVLKAANANIGAARAAFFPTISLTATAGFISSELSGLFDGSSGSYLFAPAITVPLFTAGSLQAELDVAKIRGESSIAAYEQVIQTAFREVTDALVGVQTYKEQLQAQKANLEANEAYFRHAESRYEQGVDSFLTLLDAQRSLYSSRQTYISLKLAQLENQVNLYEVLGGGWKETTEL